MDIETKKRMACERAKKWYAENKDKAKEARRRYYESNREKILAQQRETGDPGKKSKYDAEYRMRPDVKLRRLLDAAKRRALKRGVPFTLKFEDILWPTHCPVFGTKLDYASRKNKVPSPDSPSLDRHVPELGYVSGNVVVMSFRANQIKSNASASELLAVANYCKGKDESQNMGY